ncbi:preprotein translocase subunit YajC [Raineya orbicola]|jgi:preprotein translocase subunit YajC|uniref:Sec translocon accessory complex subunit YajC n=1 Tax=Raineya orbicola TaxID=2016530 RepID=A0A2N3IIU8_9BACT|nr:preprotein translocase subunit YajC [Raineya orbicola]PKQ70153.1 yajC: preprotein translocase, YajC subunit [Raineya orbicola]
MLETLFLQSQTGSQGGSSAMSLIFMVGIFAVFYFFMIRPQQKRQKEQMKFRDAVKRGDKIVTIGGLHGKIAEVNKDTIVLEIDRGVKVTLEKNAISMEGTKRYESDNAKNVSKSEEVAESN